MRLTQKERFMQNVAISETCWEWTGTLSRKGYGVAYSRSMRRQVRAHRLAYELETGVWPGESMVCHTCDNRRCVRPSHLYLGDAKTNITDAMRRRRLSYARLTEEQVLAIRVSPEPNTRIAARLGVMPTTVRSARLGISWAHVGRAKIVLTEES